MTLYIVRADKPDIVARYDNVVSLSKIDSTVCLSTKKVAYVFNDVISVESN
jgi:hypothetical protein